MEDIYAIVIERDRRDSYDSSARSIILERYVADATLENTLLLKVELGDLYGEVKIAKLVFIDEEFNNNEKCFCRLKTEEVLIMNSEGNLYCPYCHGRIPQIEMNFKLEEKK